MTILPDSLLVYSSEVKPELFASVDCCLFDNPPCLHL